MDNSIQLQQLNYKLIKISTQTFYILILKYNWPKLAVLFLASIKHFSSLQIRYQLALFLNWNEIPSSKSRLSAFTGLNRSFRRGVRRLNDILSFFLLPLFLICPVHRNMAQSLNLNRVWNLSMLFICMQIILSFWKHPYLTFWMF